MKPFYYYFKSISIYKKAFWLYLILLFIEGAMRKWYMPQLNYVWMIAREPIVIWIVLVGINKGWIKSRVAISLMVIAVIAFLFTLTVGHQDLLVAMYGFRIWFFHIPFIFIMAYLLDRNDLIWMLKFLLVIFIPMTVLYLLQWSAPGNSILNARVGGELADKEEVAYGAVRPSGTFGALGSSYYNPIVFCLFMACLLSKYYRKTMMPIRWGIPIFIVAILTMLITSVSRATILQCSLTFGITLILSATINNRKLWGNIIVGTILVVLTLHFLSQMSYKGKKLMDPITERFADAAKVEGGARGIAESRILYPYLWYREPNQSAQEYDSFMTPLLGYGLGLSSNFATQRLTNSSAWALGEYSSIQVSQEMGLPLGTIVFLIRFCFPLYLLFPAVKRLRKNRDILPFALWTLSLQYFCNGNINITTSLGFIVLLMILFLTSLKTSFPITEE